MPDLVFVPGPTVAGKRIPVPAVKEKPPPSRKAAIVTAAKARGQSAGATARAAGTTARNAGAAARSVGPAFWSARARALIWFETARAAVQFAQNVAPRERPKRARRGPVLVVGLAAGAGLAYLFDPADGKRRRSVLRDRTLATGRRAARRGAAQASYAEGKAEGAVRAATTAPRPADDQTLADRVRSEIFRRPEAPKGSVNVGVVDGVVTLRGEVEEPAEIQRLVEDARTVAGVRSVENLMHAPGVPAPTGGAA